MKKPSRLSQIIEQKRLQLAQKKESTGHAGDNSWLPRWSIALLCIVVSAGSTYALFQFVILSKVPRLMLGKWQVIEGEMEGATAEFSRNGAMIWKVDMKGKEDKWSIKGQVEVDGQIMLITTTNPMTNELVTDRQTIITLTDTQFVIEDSKGELIKLERVP